MKPGFYTPANPVIGGFIEEKFAGLDADAPPRRAISFRRKTDPIIQLRTFYELNGRNPPALSLQRFAQHLQHQLHIVQALLAAVRSGPLISQNVTGIKIEQ